MAVAPAAATSQSGAHDHGNDESQQNDDSEQASNDAQEQCARHGVVAEVCTWTERWANSNGRILKMFITVSTCTKIARHTTVVLYINYQMHDSTHSSG